MRAAMSPLKKLRLSSQLTQTQVAEAVGVTQSTYHRWESGKVTVSKGHQEKLSKVFGASLAQVRGEPDFLPFAWGDASAAHVYYGEVVFHFSGQGRPIVAPISERTRESVSRQVEDGSRFYVMETLDNRMLFVRSGAVNDIYLSSDAYDTYGPEEYPELVAYEPDVTFWEIAEWAGLEADRGDEFPPDRVREVEALLDVSEARWDKLQKEHSWEAEERQKRQVEAQQTLDWAIRRARYVEWQFASGVLRQTQGADVEDVYHTFSLLEDSLEHGSTLYFPAEGYHRAIFLNLNEVDYISVPLHSYEAGRLKMLEDLIDTGGKVH